MNAQTPYELYRVITDYEALQDGFWDRIDELETTLLAIDQVGGMAEGNAQKLLSKNPGKRVQKARNHRFADAQRKFGWESLGKMLKATGLALVLVVDDERFAPVRDQLAKRKKPLVRSIVRTRAPKWLLTPEKARKISTNRWQNVPPEMRKKMMRRMAKAAWIKRRREARLALQLQANQPIDQSINNAASTSGALIKSNSSGIA
jgi:hypothetical protein